MPHVARRSLMGRQFSPYTFQGSDETQDLWENPRPGTMLHRGEVRKIGLSLESHITNPRDDRSGQVPRLLAASNPAPGNYYGYGRVGTHWSTDPQVIPERFIEGPMRHNPHTISSTAQRKYDKSLYTPDFTHEPGHPDSDEWGNRYRDHTQEWFRHMESRGVDVDAAHTAHVIWHAKMTDTSKQAIKGTQFEHEFNVPEGSQMEVHGMTYHVPRPEDEGQYMDPEKTGARTFRFSVPRLVTVSRGRRR